MDALIETISVYALDVIGALIILVLGYWLAKYVSKSLSVQLSKSGKLEAVVVRLTSRFAFFAILTFAIVAVLEKFGFKTTGLLAALGAAGLAIGLALQGTLSNVAAGVMLLLLKPFKEGEAIKLGGDVFIVDEIGLFVTLAHEPDGPKVILPNAGIWGSRITNFSRTHDDLRRINEVVAISYSDDMERAMKIVNEVLDGLGNVVDEPARMVNISKLNESSVDILVWAWVPRADWFPTKLLFTQRVKEAFDREGVVIPFPQRDVHLHSAESKA